ncbi:MAG: bis(5'-nucleosyl)-tetraphosphatase [Anaeroplasma sp.]
MKKEYSCGAVLYTIENGNIFYVLVKEPNGSYGFPKGHRRYNETEQECAVREIHEETGIDATLIPGYKRTIRYSLINKNIKEVTYFLASYINQDIKPLDNDILEANKYSLDTAISLLKFSQLKDILLEMDYIIKTNGDML